ncbi:MULTISPECIES: response regulator transcription factor [Bifidobacterium]|uniref:DNA-binding response regulator n=2 Tax=Bifidobacterium TaxID=1678 RepID=A0A2M9HQE9_9BIFI|nr:MULTISPECIES: response regulator transcription factor [Bifidobacterium]KFI50790.1 two component transcriptional regulator, LuxR family [Bifidobacterium biavatii DSM 23969]PJM79011.1 DNA-binding response regulator [Bifidobacterium scaligerum]
MYDRERFSLAIVDNDQLTLKMLMLLIRKSLPKADVKWACRRGHDAVARCLSADSRPDVLLVDMSLEGLSGVEVCRQVRTATADIVLIGVTSFSLEHYAADALAAGAQCVMDKAQVSDICDAAVALVNGRTPQTQYVSDSTAKQSHVLLAACNTTDVTDGLPTRPATAETVASLTDREREVMRLCAQGRSSREIGELLGVGESSVKTYVMRAAKKLGARNRTQAVAEWLMLQN